ncbi:ABC transporter substrate-binding protein [Actinoallomurus soli]|uniref:ABC transporter substrate-binding protein n=1 Tax=Actinoallomurus soli TaxID=2952535 RepID=UPI0020925865|nr:substrate-binding domain-containing protein [Actinoallomurus soli]MCO5970474.1 ABC transporter substrate-binding protein [Actinoallomurus soli]
MNRYIVVASVLALAVTGACSDSSSGGSSGPKKITLIQGIANEPFYISMYCGAKAEAAKQGVQLSVQAPAQWDVAQQTQVVTSVAASRPKAVLIAPVDKDAMAGPVRQLAGNGSKVIFVDTDLSDPSLGLSRISSDNRLGGQLAARTLAGQIGDKGKVVVLAPKKGIATTDDRVTGFKEEIAKHPNIKLVSEQYPGDDAGKATEIMNGELSKDPDLAGIFASNLVTGEGAGAALKQAKKTGTVKLIEFDASPKQVEDLRAGTIQALISQEPLDIGRQGIDQAVAALNGKPVTKQIKTQLVAVTKDNVDQPDIAKYLYKQNC